MNWSRIELEWSPEFHEEQLEPDPGDEQQDQHLREGVTEPRGKADARAVGVETEREYRR